jgi:hypothetical protein
MYTAGKNKTDFPYLNNQSIYVCILEKPMRSAEYISEDTILKIFT